MKNVSGSYSNHIKERPENPEIGIGQPKLLDQVRDRIRTKHYSIRTEQTYIDWIKRFILFHDKRHPAEMGEKQRSEVRRQRSDGSKQKGSRIYAESSP